MSNRPEILKTLSETDVSGEERYSNICYTPKPSVYRSLLFVGLTLNPPAGD